jgi:hypothetical protein
MSGSFAALTGSRTESTHGRVPFIAFLNTSIRSP